MMTAIATIIGILSILGISFTVEKLPIKLAPLTWFKNFLLDDTKKSIKETQESIKEVKSDLTDCKVTINKNEINRIKQEILNFRLLIKTPGVKVHFLDFDHIFQLYDEYKAMGGNSMVDIAIEEIKMVYKETLK